MAFKIFAPGDQVQSGTGTIGVELDPDSIVPGCGISFYEVGAPTLVAVPAGTYTAVGAVTYDVASGGVTRDAGIHAYDSSFDDVASVVESGTGDTLSLSLGSFTIPAGGGYVGLSSDKNAAPTTTISETSFLEIFCAARMRVGMLRMASISSYTATLNQQYTDIGVTASGFVDYGDWTIADNLTGAAAGTTSVGEIALLDPGTWRIVVNFAGFECDYCTMHLGIAGTLTELPSGTTSMSFDLTVPAGSAQVFGLFATDPTIDEPIWSLDLGSRIRITAT